MARSAWRAARVVLAAAGGAAAATGPSAAASPAPDAGRTFATTVEAATFAKAFDHTALKAHVGPRDIEKLCDEAHRYSFAAVCVNPSFVAEARARLEHLARKDGCERTVKVCTVVGFPLGATLTRVKAFEAELAVDAGAEELDMVIPVGRLRGRADLPAVIRDVSAVTEVGRRRGVAVKVIIETSLLTEDERDLAVWLCAQAGAHFVKTSTGFSDGGATIKDVTAMAAGARRAGEAGVAPEGPAAVKASAGIRTCQDAVHMLAAGATRLGTSSGVRIFEQCAELGVLTGVDEHVRRAGRAGAGTVAKAAQDDGY